MKTLYREKKTECGKHWKFGKRGVDPVYYFLETKSWYFHDETYDIYGPYTTEVEARVALWWYIHSALEMTEMG